MKEKLKVVAPFALLILLNGQRALAANPLDEAGWEFISMARKGLFWICMFASFFGLYILALKKNDAGRKTIITAILVYIASWIVPNIFLAIQATFSGR